MIEKIPKLYINTSVFGGFYDVEFEEELKCYLKK